MNQCSKCGSTDFDYEGTYDYEDCDLDEYRCNECNNVWTIESEKEKKIIWTH